MTYLRTNHTRPNALSWPLGLGDFEKQLDTIFAGLPGLFDLQDSGSAVAKQRDVKLRWYEKADAYLVRLDLPGVQRSDISIEFEDGTVTVAATRTFGSGSESEKVKEAKYLDSLRVPEGVQADSISADFDNGVLSLTLPKTEKVKPRQISIG